jgi:membrane protease YdiL (CAAX protease family)
MPAALDTPPRGNSVIRRHAAGAYFVLTFAISWTAALLVVTPSLFGGGVSRLRGILIFPAMLLGPLLAGPILGRVVDGPGGIKAILAQLNPRRIAARWCAPLLIPPAVVFGLLWLLEHTWSAGFAPNHFWVGIAFGVPAGLCEEIGWTGFALPKLRERHSVWRAAILLGLLWSAWHLPAINYLGASAPHGHYWFAFFLAFTLAMTAMRMLITWLYENTDSLLLAQLMHVSSTGALVIFSPPVGSAREAVWYGFYGCILWMLVLGIMVTGAPVSRK